MKRSVILSIVIILLIGINFGYYQPKINSYEIQVANLTTEVANLKQTVSSREQTISSQKDEISRQESRISTLQSTVSTQEARISTQTAQISTLASEKSKLQTDLSSSQTQTNTLTTQLSSSQKRLDNILGITVNQSYQWINQYYPLLTQAYPELTWLTRQWNLSIPLSVYVEYRDRPRPRVVSTWVDMAKDPKDDPYIDQLVREITDAALEGRFTEVEKLNFVVAFVQSLPYTVDSVTTPYNEYPRYPIETLFDRGGDCEDTSILVAALLDRMGYDVALLDLKDARHMAVGISIPSGYGTYYNNNGKEYFYLETTGEGWEIGEIPPDITNRKAYIYPLRS